MTSAKTHESSETAHAWRRGQCPSEGYVVRDGDEDLLTELCERARPILALAYLGLM